MRKKILIIAGILVLAAAGYLAYSYMRDAKIHPVAVAKKALLTLERAPASVSARPASELDSILNHIDKLTATVSGIAGLVLLLKEKHRSRRKAKPHKDLTAS